MNCIVYDMPQRSPEWFAVRVGLLTGSSAAHVIAERKRGTGELACRVNLRRRLVCERLTGLAVDELPFLPHYMERAVDLEPAAFAAYEAVTGQLVQRVGFIKHPSLTAGASPDGFIGDWEGIIELKVPKSMTHLEYLQAGVLPDDYRGQVLHALWLTGADFCDFVSFDPRMPVGLELFRVRLERNDFDLMAYGRTVEAFLEEVAAELEAAKRLCAQAVA